jgi:hypothetical protein
MKALSETFVIVLKQRQLCHAYQMMWEYKYNGKLNIACLSLHYQYQNYKNQRYIFE